MKTKRFLAISILALLISGCNPQYRMVSQSQIEMKKTPRGDEIIVQKIPFISFEEVIERSPNVKSVTRMTDFKGVREPGIFTISPASTEIVYQALEITNNTLAMNLWKTATTGGPGMTRLTAGRYFDMEPAFTLDGNYIFFSSNRSSNSPTLFRVKYDGAGGITRITQSQSEDRFPSVDLKSDKIYYMSKPNSTFNWQIWHINNNGSLPTQLKEGCWPRISHDGQKVIYSALDDKTNKYNIWVMNSDGTEQTQLTTQSESNDMHPNWSPYSDKIVFTSDIGKDSNGKKNSDIWMMSSDGSNITQLTTNGSTDLMPSFSPDGKHIYFLSNRGFNWDIWRMEIAQ